METKTDRELLELAAKAAGYWSDEFNCVSDLPHLNWNPLEDDGDALRLAVNLNMVVRIFKLTSDAQPLSANFSCMESSEGYTFVATRRAIVRAAARIGESK